MVVCNRLEDSDNTDILSEAVDSGLRKLFTVITKESLMAEVGGKDLQGQGQNTNKICSSFHKRKEDELQFLRHMPHR